MTKLEVENDLLKIESIRFISSEDYNKEPPVIAFIFSNLEDGATAYSRLSELFDMNKELTISITTKSNGKADFSIIQKETADAVNRKGVSYSKYNLSRFMDSHNSDINYTIIYGFLDSPTDKIPVIASPFNPPKFFILSKLFINK